MSWVFLTEQLPLVLLSVPVIDVLPPPDSSGLSSSSGQGVKGQRFVVIILAGFSALKGPVMGSSIDWSIAS